MQPNHVVAPQKFQQTIPKYTKKEKKHFSIFHTREKHLPKKKAQNCVT